MVEWVAPLRTLITRTKVVILFSDRRFTQCLQLDFMYFPTKPVLVGSVFSSLNLAFGLHPLINLHLY